MTIHPTSGLEILRGWNFLEFWCFQSTSYEFILHVKCICIPFAIVALQLALFWNNSHQNTSTNLLLFIRFQKIFLQAQS